MYMSFTLSKILCAAVVNYDVNLVVVFCVL